MSNGYNDRTSAVRKGLILTLVKQRQNFSLFYITMVTKLGCM